MALRRFSLPIIFALVLLFAQVLARDLEEKPAADKKAVKDSDAEVDGYYGYGHGPYGHGGYGHGGYGHGPYGHYPRPCRFYCGGRCCSEEEFAAYSSGAELGQVDDEFGDDKQYGYGYGRGPHYGGYGGRPRYGFRPPRCHYYCGPHCCSAKEYAEFVQNQN
ncbi:unnamed protein product [Victoria cruziana]